jgi:hypothetical protein
MKNTNITEITLRIPQKLAWRMKAQGISPKRFFAEAVASVARDTPSEIEHLLECYKRPGGYVCGLNVTWGLDEEE